MPWTDAARLASLEVRRHTQQAIATVRSRTSPLAMAKEPVPAPSVSAQDKAIGEIKDYVGMVSDLQKGRPRPAGGYSSQDELLKAQGQGYHFDESSFSGKTKDLGKCFMNAGHQALDDSKLTYVEGYVSFMGIPIQHAWTVDSSGKVHDSTFPNAKGVGGYFGIPFKTEYLRETILRTKVWGILSYTNKDVFHSPPSKWKA